MNSEVWRPSERLRGWRSTVHDRIRHHDGAVVIEECVLDLDASSRGVDVEVLPTPEALTRRFTLASKRSCPLAPLTRNVSSCSKPIAHLATSPRSRVANRHRTSPRRSTSKVAARKVERERSGRRRLLRARRARRPHYRMALPTITSVMQTRSNDVTTTLTMPVV